MADEQEESVAGFVQGDDDAILAAVQSRDAAVTPLLRFDALNNSRLPATFSSPSLVTPTTLSPRTDPVSALRLSLTDPPYATKTISVKEASFEVVGKALSAIKEVDIGAAVGALTLDE